LADNHFAPEARRAHAVGEVRERVVEAAGLSRAGQEVIEHDGLHLRFGRQNILHKHDWPTSDRNCDSGRRPIQWYRINRPG